MSVSRLEVIHAYIRRECTWLGVPGFGRHSLSPSRVFYMCLSHIHTHMLLLRRLDTMKGMSASARLTNEDFL